MFENTPRRRLSSLSCAVLLLFVTGAARAAEPGPLAIVTAPLAVGDARLATTIERLQERLKYEPDAVTLERLGFCLLRLAQGTGDPGYYLLAASTSDAADALGLSAPRNQRVLAYALHGLHRFDEALALASELVAERDSALDHALHGDVLFDLGRLDEAALAYQALMERRPGAGAYLRAALLHWRRGALDDAARAFAFAARASSPRDAVAHARIWSELSAFELELGLATHALASAERALSARPGSAAALRAQGRVLLALGRPLEAIAPLERAATTEPLPEGLWMLAEALRDAGRPEDAAEVEARLLRVGEAGDARGLALYLASADPGDPARARVLADAELEERRDARSLDVAAWARHRGGDAEGAAALMAEALGTGTEEPRIHLHAACIAAAAGDLRALERHREVAARGAVALLPSERRRLESLTPAARTADGLRSTLRTPTRRGESS
ncbi:MAG: hypothetical protein QNK05_07955 [Myxococcota bacterium]|nr:hypothetical protein [Myxococcota bacterium]